MVSSKYERPRICICCICVGFEVPVKLRPVFFSYSGLDIRKKGKRRLLLFQVDGFIATVKKEYYAELLANGKVSEQQLSECIFASKPASGGAILDLSN